MAGSRLTALENRKSPLMAIFISTLGHKTEISSLAVSSAV